MRIFRNSIKTLIIAGALIGCAGTAQALPTYSTTFQGVTFTIIEVDSNTLSFEVKGTTPLEPDWDKAKYLGAFSLKDLGVDFSTVTAVANGPGATNLAGKPDELNNSGNTADCSKGDDKSICFDISDLNAPLDPSFDFKYTIDFSDDLNIVAAGPHLKISFTKDGKNDKVGSFYSDAVPPVTTTAVTDTQVAVTDTQTVPEPSTLLLLGSGLAVLARTLRKRDREGLGLS